MISVIDGMVIHARTYFYEHFNHRTLIPNQRYGHLAHVIVNVHVIFHLNSYFPFVLEC